MEAAGGMSVIIINKLLAARQFLDQAFVQPSVPLERTNTGLGRGGEAEMFLAPKNNDLLPEKEDNPLEVVLNEAKGHSRPRADVINNGARVLHALFGTYAQALISVCSYTLSSPRTYRSDGNDNSKIGDDPQI